MASEDPIRADVERRLRAMVDLALAGPRAAQACARRRIAGARDLVGAPLAMLRSLVDLLAAPAEPTAPSDYIDADVTTAPAAAPPAAPRGAPPTDLPIEEYESLAASQVVARLDGLSSAELRRVRRFEVAHRGRRTVLGKIDQLIDA